MQPFFWFGRQVTQIGEPLPLRHKALAVIARAVTAAALLVFSCTLFVSIPMALVGLATKYAMRPSPTPLPSAAPTPAAIPAAAAPQAASAPELWQQAEERARTLAALYTNLINLNGPEAQTLFDGIAEFRSLYDSHRSSDDMVKAFSIVDEIALNALGMQRALDQWNNFYSRCADREGVVPQPQDGNCWLHAALFGLNLLDHPEAKNYDYQTLRPVIVQWMRERYETDAVLQNYIPEAIEAHQYVENRRLETEISDLETALRTGVLLNQEHVSQAQATLADLQRAQANLLNFTLENYFAHMGQLGSHGSRAELYAISARFGVNIVIWRDIPPRGNAPRRLTNELDLTASCLTNRQPRQMHSRYGSLAKYNSNKLIINMIGRNSAQREIPVTIQ